MMLALRSRSVHKTSSKMDMVVLVLRDLSRSPHMQYHALSFADRTTLSLPKCDLVLIQNPPCLPALAAAIIARFVGGGQIMVDWHNLPTGKCRPSVNYIYALLAGVLKHFVQKLLKHPPKAHK
jgi:hypothetical protein